MNAPIELLAPAEPTATSTSAGDRVQRLGAYVAQDPGNPALLADAIDAALAGGQLDHADRFLLQAEGKGLSSAEWRFRRARLCIARRDLANADRLLEALEATDEITDLVILHDRAYVRLLMEDFVGCHDLLMRRLSEFSGTLACESLQVVWLRVLHRLGNLGEAWSWVQQELARASLAPRAQGVASLIALDREDFASARTLADNGLRADDRLGEALVARGCVALAMHHTADAEHLLQRALERAPHDGRTWSALGLCSLQAGDLRAAEERLETAVREMPRHIGTWLGLGWARLLRGNVAGALKAFEAAVQIDRNFAESHGGLGLALALSGDKPGAQRHLAVAEGLDRRNVSGRYAKALLAGEIADSKRLRAMAGRLLDRPGFFGGKLGDALREALPE